MRDSGRRWQPKSGINAASRRAGKRCGDCTTGGHDGAGSGSEHDWPEGRGEKPYLTATSDNATSRLLARLAQHDSTEQNMRLLWSYLEMFGRPLSCDTDKASHFQTTEKRNGMNRE
jgi:hypothetical protein